MVTSRSEPLPIGLVGLGKHGARYAQHIHRDVPGLRLVAICRQDEEAGRAQAQEWGVRFHRDFEELVADSDVRGVVAVVPPTLHPRLVDACVGASRPLLIEKPLAIDAGAAFALQNRVEASGLPCLVAQTLRFSAVVEQVRAWIPALGSLSQILLTQSFEPSRLGWLDDPTRSGGGNVLHTGVHMFDLLRFLTGAEVSQASCLLERVVTQETEDSFSATFRLHGSSGVILGGAAGSRATESRAGQVRIVGEKGQILADHVRGTAAWLEGRQTRESRQLDDVPTVRRVLEAFVGAAGGEAPPCITAADGAAAVAIADACYRSAETGALVRVPRPKE